MSQRRRQRPARNTGLLDQVEAASLDVLRTVQESASRVGRPLTIRDVEHIDDLAGDPLAEWAVATYLAIAGTGEMRLCEHLIGSHDAPSPEWWTSAAPGIQWCGRGPCAALAVDLVLRAAGMVPARCSKCGGPRAEPRLDLAFGTTRLVFHLCSRCFHAGTPAHGGGAA